MNFGGAEALDDPLTSPRSRPGGGQHSVPINILQGVAEGPAPALTAPTTSPQPAGPLSQGRSVPDAIASLFPDGKLPWFIDTVRDRAKAIGKTYEQPAAA